MRDSAAPLPVPVPTSGPPQRPAGITILSAFFAAATSIAGLAGISIFRPGGVLEPMWNLNPQAHDGFTGLHGWAPPLLGAVSLACAAAAYGLYRGRRWGYYLGIVLLFCNLVGDAASLALGKDPRAAVGLPVVALLLWYLSSGRVRGYFASKLFVHS